MSKPTLNVVEEIRQRETGLANRRESESRLSPANIHVRLLSWCRPIPQETVLIYIRTLYRPVARILF